MASKVKVDTIEQQGSTGIVISHDVKLASGTAIKNAAGTALLGEDGALGSSVVFPAGHIVQVAYYETGAFSATGTTRMVDDDTPPTTSEGTEFMTLAITPTSATNKLLVQVVHNSCTGYTVGASNSIGAIFNTDTVDGVALHHATEAIAMSYHFSITSYSLSTASFTAYVVAGTTSETTFRFRSGGTSVGTHHFNGVTALGPTGAARGGGALKSSITITEIIPPA